MQFIRDNQADSLPQKPTAITIGNFDGLHIGHRALTDKLVKLSKEYDLSPWMVTFDPSPKEFFTGQRFPRLMARADKLDYLEKLGFDGLYSIDFDQAFAKLEAKAFIEKVVVKSLKAKVIVVGHDFHFGHQQSGDVGLLRQLGAELGFKVEVVPPVALDGTRVSSTLIREQLSQGLVQNVERLLGRPYFITARVQVGDKRGRLLGFPTANLMPPQLHTPAYGVYLTKVTGLEKPYFGVANLGVRPTVDGETFLCEVHLFDFARDIYGEHLQVQFLQKIREEKRFDSLEALRVQIDQDVQWARALANQIGTIQ